MAIVRATWRAGSNASCWLISVRRALPTSGCQV